MRARKKKRIGTITCAIKYTVNLDKKAMVAQAKECFYDDMYEAIVKSSGSAQFESLLVVKHDPKLKEKDIDEFLREDAEDEDDLPQDSLVSCKFCHQEEVAELAHRHDGGWVCTKCWDDRLGTTG